MNRPDEAPTAFKIQQAMAAAMSLAARLQADDPDTDAEDLAAAIAAETDVYDVLRRVIRASIESETFADAASERLKALTARRDRFKQAHEAARATAFAMLDALGQRFFRDAEFTASITAGRAAVIITDEAALPAEFVKIERSARKAEIAASMKVGQVVAGAEMSNAAPSLTVRKN